MSIEIGGCGVSATGLEDPRIEEERDNIDCLHLGKPGCDGFGRKPIFTQLDPTSFSMAKNGEY